MISFLKKLKDSFLFSLKLKRLTKINSKFVILKIFLIRTFFSYPCIRNLIKTKKGKNFLSDNFFEKKTSSNSVVNNLDKKGFDNHSLTSKVTNSIIEEIPSLVQNISLKGRKHNKIDTSKFYCKSLSDFKEFTLKNRISHIKMDLNLEKNSNLKNFVLSDFAIDIAQSYLNSRTFTVSAVIFISNPLDGGIKDEELSDNAQKFHTDINYTKFFKVLIYLNDVNDENGPHIFIPGSHKKKKRKHYKIERYEDEDIFKNYNQKIKFTGKKGTIFYEDTFGFHKGDEPKSNSRIALIIEYGKNNIKYGNYSEFVSSKIS